MSTFTLAISFDHFQFALIHGPNIPGSYAILLFTASDLASITSHVHSWVLFLIWLHPFILSGVISSLISSSILGNYRPGELIFQCPIFLPFHTVHGVLKARILKWFAIPLSSGPHSLFQWTTSKIILSGCKCYQENKAGYKKIENDGGVEGTLSDHVARQGLLGHGLWAMTWILRRRNICHEIGNRIPGKVDRKHECPQVRLSIL